MIENLVSMEINKHNIDVIEYHKLYDYGAFKVKAFPLVHDILNCGWKIYFPDGKKAIYAVDCKNLDGITAKGYDLYLIEANYGETEIKERIRNKEYNGEFCYEYRAIKNHMSREKAERWVAENKGDGSEVIFLHQHKGS